MMNTKQTIDYNLRKMAEWKFKNKLNKYPQGCVNKKLRQLLWEEAVREAGYSVQTMLMCGLIHVE